MRRQGAALVEVLVALVILASAGVSAVAFLIAMLDAEARMEAREREFARAERVLAATALLDAAELDLRLGERPQGNLVVSTGRPEPGLYRIAVASASAPERELVVTVVYRPPAASDTAHVP